MPLIQLNDILKVKLHLWLNYIFMSFFSEKFYRYGYLTGRGLSLGEKKRKKKEKKKH